MKFLLCFEHFLNVFFLFCYFLNTVDCKILESRLKNAPVSSHETFLRNHPGSIPEETIPIYMIHSKPHDDIIADLEKNHANVRNRQMHVRERDSPIDDGGGSGYFLNNFPVKTISEHDGYNYIGEQSASASNYNKEYINQTEILGIIPMSETRHSHFVGPVKIGTPPQTLWLIFDTGSTNIQVVGANCTVPSCLKIRRFHPEHSSTFSKFSPSVKLDVTFGTGRIHAELGMDTVSIGSYAVPKQTIAVIDNESASKEKGFNIFDLIDFQGIVGLGFPSLSSAGQTPFFDNIMKSKIDSKREFAIYMSNPKTSFTNKQHPDMFPSAFFIGGVDNRFFEPPLQFVPVVREHYWEVSLDSFWVGDTRFCCEENTDNYIIVDSGTSFNTLPYKEIHQFFDLVPDRPCININGDIELSVFPTLIYKLTGGVDIILTPDMYVIPGSNGFCKAAYMQIDVPSKFGHGYILGSIAFMRHYFTVYHRGTGINGDVSMLGIAKAKHTHTGLSLLQTLGSSMLSH